MSRTFNSIGALATFLEGVAHSLPQAQQAALDDATTFLLQKVKEIPGNYQSDPAWPALAEATVEDRTRKGFTPDDPLRRTGEFAETFQKHVDGPTRAEVGSNDERAAWFELGTSRMPPRPVLGAAKAQHDPHLVEIVGRRIQQHIGGRD
ncbi:hypothetical protein MKK69_19455 [Methylobacterium sp. J-026]|uniref:hypothetical protein n=1 Tax=Methylobacterium sp. J-026 TaxID=2836624 RepID=UPI001FBC0BCC|nr:hypothetical protein [Methylobacterium sp. J-026]MCJ2136201.1 hypothetical protein [Methylobacterium sp. J-026]